jgi:hypothetical protein
MTRWERRYFNDAELNRDGGELRMVELSIAVARAGAAGN